MPEKVIQLENIKGLSAKDIEPLRRQYGKNIFQAEPSRRFFHIVWDIVKEPMFILLAIACTLYFILGSIDEGIMTALAISLVTTISLYQEVKSNRALEALKQLTDARITVIRDGKEIILHSEDLLPGDIMLLSEGMNVPADAIILQENDLSINESVISGESFPVEKNETEGSNILYQGTTINAGKCVAQVSAIGNNTVLGKLGKTIGTYQPPKTLLQQQINRFVRYLAFFGLAGFFIIFLLNYFDNGNWVTSLLFALTLALSAIPEEVPVAFSSFMALGAYKMSKLGIISRQPQVVENLGAVSVICLDKTGTITENKMEVKTIYDFNSDVLIELNENSSLQNTEVLRYAVLASEQDPFDAMEKAIWDAVKKYQPRQPLKINYEYPLEGRPPMMTHVYITDGSRIAAAKGAVERIIKVCQLGDVDKNTISQQTRSLASKGYRVLAVASSRLQFDRPLPAAQDDFDWHFEGLLALYDPPKKNIPGIIREFHDAKIEVKMITGDYPETAVNIAGQSGMHHHQHYITGDQVTNMSDVEIQEAVKNTNIFARMFPDAKLKVIEAIKANGQIVAMTGDGVNDGPALKSANIGIAMGKKGTEIARQASDLILTDDNLERMVTAIREGRKIFTNLKKAIRYIISIHIPIVLTASIPIILGWAYPNIFTPIHVIFLELIMGPTCSIFFEREPVEGNSMLQKPRQKGDSLFTRQEIFISILQGLLIAIGSLALYFYFMTKGTSLEQTRTIVFTTLILSNIFLTFVDRSFTQTFSHTIRYKNNLAPVILIISTLFLVALHFVPFVRELFQLATISRQQFWLCLGVAFTCVFWFEAYKIVRLSVFKVK
ncbi:cation-translocating P-type ATPase [Terrimonas alba]|uniref:cation-translocating P-type ATPase n=1 Tax=Terrimonas alba TaxID=3349636 RepID=UPI0035F495B8